MRIPNKQKEKKSVVQNRAKNTQRRFIVQHQKHNSSFSLFHHQRKAQISMQFNWIFVLVIGAVLLAFFFTAIKSGSKSSEQKISVSLAKHFDTILFTTGQTPGTLKTYETPLVTLHFICDDTNGFYNYKVGDLKVRDTKYDVLFAPEELTGKSIITWTQKWKVPYSVGTFMYVTNKDQLYIFYKGSTPSHNVKQLIKDFPANISTYVVDEDDDAKPFPTDEELNYKAYTYVFFADDLSNINSRDIINAPNKKTTVVILKPAKNDPYAYGDVFIMTPEEFRSFNIASYSQTELISETNQQTSQTPITPSTQLTSSSSTGRNNPSRKQLIHSGYLGKASFYGAVFSSSKDTYECNMRKAMHSLTLLTILQLNKIELVNNSVSGNCKDALGIGVLPDGPYETLLSIQQKIYNQTLGQQQNGIGGATGILFDYMNIPSIYSEGLQLQTQNDRIQMMGSCPAIY